MKKQLTEAQRRENVLVLRLSAREQELQDVAAVAVNYKKLQVSMIFLANINWLAPEHCSKSSQAQTPTLRKTMLDPAINYMYQKMRTELKETKEKLDLAQSELAACKFTPDSQTGKKLMSRCRTLIQVDNSSIGEMGVKRVLGKPRPRKPAFNGRDKATRDADRTAGQANCRAQKEPN